MRRHLVGMLVVALGLLAAACAGQEALGPAASGSDRPAFRSTPTDTSTTPTGTKKGGPGGSAGGFK